MNDKRPNILPTKTTAERQQQGSGHSRTASSGGSPVEVYAKAGTPGCNNWCLLLKLTVGGGQRVKARLPASLVREPKRIVEFLESYGVSVPSDSSKLVRSIQKAQVKRFMELVPRPGWYSDQFLLGAETLGKGNEDLMLDDRLDAHLARVGNRGSLDDWRAQIAERCTNSSYLIFGLAIGFAAPLLQLTSAESGVTSVESGGFHFWASSTKGKTTVQRCVASIFGKGTRDSDGYLRSWKTTATGMEEAAVGHCDLPLILDEMKLLANDQHAAAKLACDAAYLIADGNIKARSVAYTGPIPPDARHFRVLIVSSGEVSLGAQAGNNRLDGEAVRLIDIPVPNRSTGIFDRLPIGATAEDSSRLAEALAQASATCYGMAGKVFIENLVRDLRDDHDRLLRRLQDRIDRFLTKSGVNRNDPYEVRFAKRFALAYAAGLLAIDYDVVPWDRRIVYQSIRRVYRKAWSKTTRPVDPVQMAADKVVQKIREKIQQGRVVDLTKKTEEVDAHRLESASVILIPHSDGLPLAALRRNDFGSLIGAQVSLVKVAKELEQRGLLIPRSDGRRTRQVQIPGSKRRLDYYCLRLPEIKDARTKGTSKNDTPRV